MYQRQLASRAACLQQSNRSQNRSIGGTDLVTQRARNEIDHGRKLTTGDAERTWGWGSPAGSYGPAVVGN